MSTRFAELDVVPVGICVVDRQLQVEFWNRCLEGWTGRSRDTIVGRGLGDLFPKFAEPRHRARILSVFDSGAPVIFSSQLHKWMFEVTCRDGAPQQQHCIVSSVEDATTGERKAMVMVQDVTDQSRLLHNYRQMRDQALRELASREAAERSARETSERLAAANRELELFASVAAHDLRAPLRRVRVLGDLMECDGGVSETAIGHLRLMRDSIGRMDALIRDLHEYSLALGDPPANELVRLADVVADVLTDLEPTIELAQAEITVHTSVAELPEIWGHAGSLRQLVQNLVTNAMKYRSDDDPPRVDIFGDRREPDTPAEICRLHVRDNGIGIGTEDRHAIFDPFRRLHEQGKYEGSGLGLALCAKVCARHGGTISVESEPGSGSTFTVTLPRTAQLAA